MNQAKEKAMEDGIVLVVPFEGDIPNICYSNLHRYFPTDEEIKSRHIRVVREDDHNQKLQEKAKEIFEDLSNRNISFKSSHNIVIMKEEWIYVWKKYGVKGK